MVIKKLVAHCVSEEHGHVQIDDDEMINAVLAFNLPV